MSLDKDPVRLSPAFPPPVSLSEQLDKPRPPIHPKNGRQPLLPPPPPPAANQRKRRFSVGGAFKGVAKRRRRANSESQAEPLLPSHFLLGGNIFDPLNLNSLLDEEVNRLTNQETPLCSPLPSHRDAVDILVPRDATDPLNLRGGEGDVLLSPPKTRRRHRYRRHGGEGGETGETPARLFSVPASPLSCELNTSITCRDDVAPPPILPRRHTHPPPGSRRRRAARSMDVTMETTTRRPATFQTPLGGGAKDSRCASPVLGSASERKKDQRRHQHGSRCRYYGYHGCYGDSQEGRVGAEPDPRLRLLEADWFSGRTVLDLGCGAGHMTLAIARRFGPAHILGVELDGRLVRAARQNVRHFLSHDLVAAHRQEVRRPPPPLPVCFRVSRGPLAAPPLLMTSSPCRFPGNVTFIQGDYVSEGGAWPGRGQYDVILVLGLTRWVQLRSGDQGLVRLFRRAYQSLAPGGKLVLEPQPWRRCGRSNRDSSLHHFQTLRLRPERFTSLLTDTIGFTSYRPITHSGNQRPIYLFHKGSTHRK